MGHTNSTTYYNLPQFLTSDKPAWLTDVNNAMSDIDAAIHSAQSDATTAGNNATQAISDASAASSAASAADAKGAGAVASIAPAFDATSTYSVGERVMYNSLLYTCTTAVITPGAWTGSTNWSRTNISSLTPNDADGLPYIAGGATSTYDEIAALKTAVSNINDWDLGTRDYLCICASTQTSNNKQLFINMPRKVARSVVVNSIKTSGDVTDYKTDFALSNNTEYGSIVLYSSSSSIVHGRLYTVNLTIS